MQPIASYLKNGGGKRLLLGRQCCINTGRSHSGAFLNVGFDLISTELKKRFFLGNSPQGFCGGGGGLIRAPGCRGESTWLRLFWKFRKARSPLVCRITSRLRAFSSWIIAKWRKLHPNQKKRELKKKKN